ncbi:MAG: response regulator, partial [Bacteroidales bacterium]|nr:response regulator [Bacteroidales bacterium]
MLTNFSNKKVLVVEDEEHNWLLIKEYLEIFDINPIWFKCAKAALDFLKYPDNTFQLILLDMKLPQMSGYELAPKLKTLMPDSCIIAQTAYAMPDDEERCYRCGCDGYIAKPYTIDQLEEVVELSFIKKNK